MSWLAVLLIGFSVTDLAHSVKPIRFFPECLGALVALVVGLLAGLTSGRDVIGLLGIAGSCCCGGSRSPGASVTRAPPGSR